MRFLKSNRQTTNLNYQVELIEDGVVLGQVLVSVHSLLLEVFAEKRTVDRLVLRLLHRLASGAPLLKRKSFLN